MDSDLSLLEIAGEDDSLLQIPRDDSGVNNKNTIFSCSPLHCLRSLPPRIPQTEGRVGAVCIEKRSSSPQNGLNKENISGGKFETPKLNVEPQQMKRKKKGGGYNLRKSLAWDRAFFTEEGVLNPLELSMISGNHSNELTIIHEEDENLLVGEASIVGVSSKLHEIEENLFKQASADQKTRAYLSPKSDAKIKGTSASASLATRKVLAVNDNNRNRSKRNACPRLNASSSPDMAKAKGKESKVSKIPVVKTHVPVITTTARSGASSMSYSKKNQNAHSAANVQKKAGVGGLPKNLKNVPIVDEKCSLTRTLTQHAGKHTNNSISETHPPLRLQHLVTEGNKGLKIHTDKKNQQTQFQTVKPSGLRMPSPSLGFFSQQKEVNLHSALHKSSKPGKPAESNIPKPKKVAANSVMESYEFANGAAESFTPKLSLSDVRSEQSLQPQNNQKLKVELTCFSLGSGEIAEQEKDEKIHELVNKKSLEQVEPFKSENALNKEDGEFHRNDSKLLLDSGMDEQLETKVDQDLFVSQEPQSINHSSMQGTLPRIDNLSDIALNVLKKEVDEQTKPLGSDAQISNEILVLQANHDTLSKDSRHSGGSKEYNNINIAPENSSLWDLSETILETSLEGTHSQSTEEVKVGVGEHFTLPVNKGCNISELQFGDESSSKGTSLHCDSLISQHDGCGNFEHHARLLTPSKINYMLYENENLVANRSHFLDVDDSFEKSANIDSDTKDFTKGGGSSPSGLHEQKPLAQAIREHDYTRRLTEDLQVKDAELRFSDENLTKDQFTLEVGSTNKESPLVGSQSPSLVVDVDFQHVDLNGGLLPENNASEEIREHDYTRTLTEDLQVEDAELRFSDENLTKDQFTLEVGSTNKESPLLGSQSPSLVVDVDFQHVDLLGGLLPDNNASEEIRNKNLLEGVLGQCNDYPSTYSNSNSLDADDGAKCLQMDAAKIVEDELNHKDNAANLITSIRGNGGHNTDVVDWNCNERCSLSESPNLQVADSLTSLGRASYGSEASSLKRKSLSQEAENCTSGEDQISSPNIHNQIAEDSGEIIHPKKSATKRMQDVNVVIPPPNAAPFSDEWLAAIEAAGEEILTMKRGAVQNSPPEKPQHEPGPWSPVRRKNQEIGPYDCTKHTKTNIPDPSSQ